MLLILYNYPGLDLSIMLMLQYMSLKKLGISKIVCKYCARTCIECKSCCNLKKKMFLKCGVRHPQFDFIVSHEISME